MTKTMMSAAAAGVLLSCAAPAAAVTIDFESLAFDGTTNDGPRGFGSPLTIGDFTITASDPFGLPPILVYGRQSSNNPDLGGASIFPNRNATGLTIARTDGAAFTFNAVDLTFAFDDQNALFPGGVATYAFGGTSVSRAFDNLAGFQTFRFDATGITSLNISADSAFAIDNLVLDEAAAVPEPASWAMMIGGFGLAGGALRRRRATRMQVSFG